MGRLLTTTEAAELLGIKPKSLSVYACQGRITPTRKNTNSMKQIPPVS